MEESTLFFLFLTLTCLITGFGRTCEIEGLGDYDWMSEGYNLLKPINDSHVGDVARLKVKKFQNFLGAKKSKYLSARMENDEVIVFTTANFSKFEEENPGVNKKISLELHFMCDDDYPDEFKIYQEVIDINTHNPVLSKVYEYNIGMTIEEGFDLTNLLAINASDVDFTNDMIYFTMDYNDDFTIDYLGKSKGNGVFSTSIKTQRFIAPPYRRKYTIVATDNGIPTINTTATLIVNVYSVERVCVPFNHGGGASTIGINMLLFLMPVVIGTMKAIP